MGTARISDTERFYGYQRELGSYQQDIEQHQGSQLTSLTGNVTAIAQGNYHQASSELLAKEKINVSASSIKMDNTLNSQSMHSHESDLKIGNFTRVKSPIIDLINTLESTLKNKDASDRVKAANLMSLAAQGYNLSELTFDPSKWKMDKNPMDAGYLFRVESGAGFSHKRDNREGFEKTSVANRLNAKDITLTAHDGKLDLTHTDLTSRDENGSRIKDSQITLNAKEGIDYRGGEDLRYYKGRQQSSGVEVGTAFSVGAKMGWSFYLQAGFNQGKQDREGQLVQNSQVDTERFQINTGNYADLTNPSGQTAATHQAHANLSAVTAKAKTITTNIDGSLNIESRQSHEKERVKNSGAGIQLEGGFGTSWNASVNGNASKGNSERHQVIEQAGLFAEEGGYHIHADNVHLKGAAITSTNPNNSELTTNKLTFEDIENRSSSQAMSASMSAGYGKKEVETLDSTGKTKKESVGNPQYSPGLPMAEKESDRTTTKATLSEGKILLNKESTPTEITAAQLGINTDITQANAQTETPKDINKTLNEQQQIAQAVGHVKSAVENYVKNQRKAAEADIAELEKQQAEARAKGDTAQVNKLESQLDTAKQRKEDWGTSGANKRIADTVTGILTTALAGAPTEALATTAVSPWVNQEIKRLTTDKTTGEVDKTTNAIAHAVWGAIEAVTAKGNATAGAIAGASSELAAPLIAKALYGTDDPKQLTETQRQNIVNLSSLAGAIGASVASGNGNSTKVLTSANQGAEIGKRAVEHNFLSTLSQDRRDELYKKIKDGIATKDDIKEYIGYETDDHTSDYLADKARNHPEDMTNDEWNQLGSYLQRYASESLRSGETAKEINQSLKDIVSGNYIKGYGYAYALNEKYRSTLPSRWTTKGKSDEEILYQKLYAEYIQNPNTIENSFDVSLGRSTSEAGLLFGTGGGLALVKTVDKFGKVADHAFALAVKSEQQLNKTIPIVNDALNKAYINGQLAYADAVGKGTNLAREYVRNGVKSMGEQAVKGALINGAITAGTRAGFEINDYLNGKELTSDNLNESKWNILYSGGLGVATPGMPMIPTITLGVVTDWHKDNGKYDVIKTTEGALIGKAVDTTLGGKPYVPFVREYLINSFERTYDELKKGELNEKK